MENNKKFLGAKRICSVSSKKIEYYTKISCYHFIENQEARVEDANCNDYGDYDDYNDIIDDYPGLNAEELAERGLIEFPKPSGVVIDGEAGFFQAMIYGEDW